MNCVEFRRQLGVDPQSNAAEFARHRAECPRCAEAAGRAGEFERGLTRALNIEVPPQLADSILLAQATAERRRRASMRRGGIFALAASLALAVGVVGMRAEAKSLPALAVEQEARFRAGLPMSFNGTAGVWRRAAIDAAGGWEHDTLTEDTDLSYRAQLKGWKFLYLPGVECASELPVDMNGFKAQQARWAKGLMQTAKKILPKVFKSKQPWHVKAEAFFHLTANISYPLMVLLSTMLLPAMIVRFYQGYFQMLFIDLPLFLASTCSISSFYLVSQRELRPKTWMRTFLYMPFVMATGIGISVRNAQAVIEAIIGKKSEFARTPKFKIEGKQGTFAKKSYKNKAGWMPYAEILLGVYFSLTIVYAIMNENYATVPFLLLFVWGYLYTGFMSLGQTYFAHLRFDVNAPEMRPAASGAPGF